jgi:uncharacterized protein with GYD domain
MNAKRKGTRNEHRYARLLEAAGYRVTRAAASLGEWDLVGCGSTDFVLVQVKTRDWPGAVAPETLKAFPAPANARKLLTGGEIVNGCPTCGNSHEGRRWLTRSTRSACPASDPSQERQFRAPREPCRFAQLGLPPSSRHPWRADESSRSTIRSAH